MAASVAASLLDRARASGDSLDARLLLAAAVQRIGLEVGARLVVVGGTAVDFYAAGALGTSESLPAKWEQSGDVDVVVLDLANDDDLRPALIARLERDLGMEPWYILPGRARIIRIPDFAYTLELVGRELRADPRGERVFTALIDDVHPITFRGPEETILSYAESGWHMRHGRDWERALAVYRAMRDRLDVAWMAEEAARRRQGEALAAVMALRPTPWLPARREDDD